jgi:chromosome segregation ATPase
MCCFIAGASAVNPLSKVISLLEDLHEKVSADAASEVDAFKAYSEWCTEKARDDGHQHDSLEAEIAALKAEIQKAEADTVKTSEEVSTLIGEIATAETELKEASDVRKKELNDFAASEEELVGVIDTLQRAIEILEREMAKNPAFLQKKVDLTNINNVVSAISAVVDAASLSSSDTKRLMSFVQDESGDDDDDLGAPKAAVYKSHSSDIIDVLTNLLTKAQTQLDAARKAETNAAHNFALLKQSLEDQKSQNQKALDEAKAEKDELSAELSSAKADLAEAEKSLKVLEESMAASDSSCAQVAKDHELSVAAFAEELKAIREGTSILRSETGGAEEQTYSFMQTGDVSRSESKSLEVLDVVRRLAKKEHSASLAQLASRIGAVFKFGAGAGEDPFQKVKGLITDLIKKLQEEASAEASQKAYCDEETAKANEKKADLEASIAKLSSKIEKATARAITLDGEVSEHQAELASLSKEQLEMDTMRGNEREIFAKAKADLEQGIAGVQKALMILRDHYGTSDEVSLSQQPARPELHQNSEGAASSIIGILQVVESDFSKNLAELTLAEDEAESGYQKLTQQNKVTKASLEQDVKYKGESSGALKKEVGEWTGDKDSATTELSAVVEYLSKLNDMCVAKAETYEETVRRRAAEIAGLKEALSILSEGALLQKNSLKRVGISAH